MDGSVDATMIIDCTTLPDGTACDDRNVCTASARCIAGACVADMPQATCTVANTVTDFDTTQGTAGWYYGFWNAETDATYEGATDFEPGVWGTDTYRPAQGTVPFLYLTLWGTHPSQTPHVVTVRRWVSDVLGPAVVTVDVAKVDPSCGDGVQALLLVDDAIVWQQAFAFDDVAGVVMPVPVELVPGTRVELLVEARLNDACDTTDTALTVASP